MKGQPIRFIAGKYADKKGWLDTEGKTTAKDSTNVIVQLKTTERHTYVKDSSYELEPTVRPASYAFAVIQQCPDIQTLLVATCRACAKADMGRDPEGCILIMQQAMAQAIEWQEAKGSKALYRKISFQPPLSGDAA
jgi:hypothetical protein